MNLWEFLAQCSFWQWMGVLSLASIATMAVGSLFPLFVIRNGGGK